MPRQHVPHPVLLNKVTQNDLPFLNSPFVVTPVPFGTTDGIPPPINVSAAGPSATGLVRPNVLTSTAQTSIIPKHLGPPGPPLVEHGHRLAANRLCEDEYTNYLFRDSVTSIISSEFVCTTAETPELVQGAPVVKVKGRLKACVKFWESISAPQFVLSTIREGYKIPFLHTPPRASFPNNKSTNEHKQFVASAIQDLLLVGSILECMTPPTGVDACQEDRLRHARRFPFNFILLIILKSQIYIDYA